MYNYVKFVLMIVLAMTLVGLSACQNKAATAAKPMPLSLQASTLDEDWSIEWWIPRHEQKLRDKTKQEINLVFIGDSITHGWENEGQEVWGEYYGLRGGFNLGFSGDRTENVLWRLRNGALDGVSPKLIVLMIGTNNTGHRMDSAEDTFIGIKAIIDELIQRTPSANILVLGLFPRGIELNDPMRERNARINTHLPELSTHTNVYFRNIGEVFTENDGTISEEIMPDFLHLSSAGYRLWAEAIEPDIIRLIGE